MDFGKFELVWVTNRRLSEDFFADVRRVAQSGRADKILLRESDLPERKYENLARKTLEIIAELDSSAQLVLHTYASVASKLGVGELHLPFANFTALSVKRTVNLADLNLVKSGEFIFKEKHGRGKEKDAGCGAKIDRQSFRQGHACAAGR